MKELKKYALDLCVVEKEFPRDGYVLLKLNNPLGALPEMRAGQFVELLIAGSSETFLRRPISINYIDKEKDELWLLIHIVGNGTKYMSELHVGDTINCVLPLGNGFTLPTDKAVRPLLVGGGVGVAPLLYLGMKLKEMGIVLEDTPQGVKWHRE